MKNYAVLGIFSSPLFYEEPYQKQIAELKPFITGHFDFDGFLYVNGEVGEVIFYTDIPVDAPFFIDYEDAPSESRKACQELSRILREHLDDGPLINYWYWYGGPPILIALPE